MKYKPKVRRRRRKVHVWGVKSPPGSTNNNSLGKLSAAQKKKFWKYAGWTAFGVSTLVVARELYLVFGPYREEKRAMYEAAFMKAISTGKKLIVLGDPDGGFIHRLLGRDFQCGAICIDPKGCGGCTTGVRAIMDDPTHALADMPANSAVIFDSGLFAFTDDGYTLAEQMKRVSGGDLFMWDVSPWSLAAFFESKRKRRLTSAPPASRTLQWKTGFFHSEPRTSQSDGAVALMGLGNDANHPIPMHHYERLVSRNKPFVYFEI